MTPSHTPAPWTFVFVEPKYAEFWAEAYRIQTTAPTHPDIASVLYRDDDGETEANAHLIAAAPDLLAVCRRLLNDPELEDETAVQLLTDVIAKAEGSPLAA